MDRRWYAVLVALPALYLVVNGVRFVANGDAVGVALLLLGLLLVPLGLRQVQGVAEER